MTDASGTTNYFYNGTRMFAKDTPMGTLRYTYDPMGNVLTIGSQTFSSTLVGPTATYTYDKLNRLSTSRLRIPASCPVGHNSPIFHPKM